MSAISRIHAYIKFKRLTKSEFYRAVGLSNGYLDKVKEIGSDKIESIISTYNDLNLEWLITGNGEMLKKEADINITDGDLRKLDKKIIELQDEVIRLQKENADLKMTKSDKPVTVRPVQGKLEKK